MSNPTPVTVRSTLQPGKSVPECLTTLDAVCTAAEQCPEVQSSPVAKPAFDALKVAVDTARTSLDNKAKIALALIAAGKALNVDFADVRVTTRSFETAVDALAKGNAQLIAKAGLGSRPVNPTSSALGKVTVVHSKPGKHVRESIVSWPAAPGATGYAIEANFEPQNPAGTYTALNPGTGRRRTVKGPTPAGQFLVRVAAVASDGTQSEWSDPILATAL